MDIVECILDKIMNKNIKNFLIHAGGGFQLDVLLILNHLKNIYRDINIFLVLAGEHKNECFTHKFSDVCDSVVFLDIKDWKYQFEVTDKLHEKNEGTKL